MSPPLAWLFAAFVTAPNGSVTSTFVPGIATPEACHHLAVNLNVPNHQCISYPMAVPPSGMQVQGTSAPEATNSITMWTLTVRPLSGQAPTVLQGIVSEAACERAAEQFGEPDDSRWHLCVPIIRKIVQPQSRGLFW